MMAPEQDAGIIAEDEGKRLVWHAYRRDRTLCGHEITQLDLDLRVWAKRVPDSQPGALAYRATACTSRDDACPACIRAEEAAEPPLVREGAAP